MITRKQYLKGEFTHQEYYGQFVTEDIKRIILTKWDKQTLKIAQKKDEHLNSLSLKLWEMLAKHSPYPLSLLTKTGEIICEKDKYYMSIATKICIYKEAANQIIKEN